MYIGGGALALYTLHQGSKDGLLVLAGSVLAMGGLWFIAMHNFLPGLFMLVYWLPVWLASVVLRDTRSLSWSVMALTGFNGAGCSAGFSCNGWCWPHGGSSNCNRSARC